MNKFLVVLLLVILFVFLGGFIWWNRGTSAMNTNDKQSKIFVVNQGEPLAKIATKLEGQGLISDPIVFRLLVKQLGLESKIQAGSFRISPSMKPEAIAKLLTQGNLDIWITIPEGKRAEEVADTLEVKLPTYDDSWREILNENEGYLFPDTYLLPKDASIDQIVSTMRNNFDAKYEEVTNNTSYNQEEIVIIASMIEREANKDEDRPLVSSVMHNRLGINMALQIDATVQYALGYSTQERTWWKRGLTRDDLDIDSLYNTYANPGLPPAPIANPGLKALQAAASPEESDYIYYITDKNGVNRYGRTLQEHNNNISKYGL